MADDNYDEILKAEAEARMQAMKNAEEAKESAAEAKAAEKDSAPAPKPAPAPNSAPTPKPAPSSAPSPSPKPSSAPAPTPSFGGPAGGGSNRFGAAMLQAGEGRGRSKLKIFIVAIIVFLFLFTGFGIIPPPAAKAMGSGWGYISSGEASHDVSSVAYGEQSTISKAINDWQTAYRRSISQATGQSIEGTVENVQEFIGIKFDKPWVDTPPRINFGESVEVSTVFEGYNPKGPFSMALVCTYNEQKAFSGFAKDTIGGNVIQYAGQTKQTIRPETFSGKNRYTLESVTCRPKFPACGDYIVYITGRSDGMRIDSHLSLYFYDDETLKVELEKAAISKNRRELTANDIPNMLNELHPEIRGHQPLSESEKGTVALYMLIKKMPLVPYRTSENEELKLWVSIENREQGAIENINSLKIIYPPTFRPIPGTCDDWEIGDQAMTLKASYVSSAKLSIQGLKGGVQRLLPSCYFKYTGDQNLIKTSPILATWYGSVDYNYIIQRADRLEVRNKDSTVCKKQTAAPTTVSAASSTVATQTVASLKTKEAEAKYLEDAKSLYGEKGTNLQTVDMLGKSVMLNAKVIPDMNNIIQTIAACSEGKAYFERNPVIISGQEGLSPYNPNLPSLMSFGAGIKIVSTQSNTGTSTSSTVTTDIPACVISAFKNAGWVWGGDMSPRDPSLFEEGLIYRSIGVVK